MKDNYIYLGNCTTLSPETMRPILKNLKDVSRRPAYFKIAYKIARRQYSKELADNFQRIEKNNKYLVLIDSGREYIFKKGR